MQHEGHYGAALSQRLCGVVHSEIAWRSELKQGPRSGQRDPAALVTLRVHLN